MLYWLLIAIGILGILLVLLVFLFIGFKVFRGQGSQSEVQARLAQNREGGIRRFEDSEQMMHAMYEDFIHEQIERERALRIEEGKGVAIVSATARPFKGKPLPGPNATLPQIARMLNIRPIEEVDFNLFSRNPHKAITK